MCGGKFSEALIQNLVINGVNLLSSAVQMELDSYLLDMDVGTVRIDTPLQEKRIAAVTRSSPARAKSRICSGNALLAISRVSSRLGIFLGYCLDHCKDRFTIERTFHDIFIKGMRGDSIIEG